MKIDQSFRFAKYVPFFSRRHQGIFPVPKLLRTLIVEDSEADPGLLRREPMRAGYDPACKQVETADAMGAALDRQGWGIVISDYTMPRNNFLHPANSLDWKTNNKRGGDLCQGTNSFCWPKTTRTMKR